MINRYIGNKKEILSPLVDIIEQQANPGDLICDIFSGTLAVSFELKRRGFGVASNDVNFFSSAYARAFLEPTDVPDVDVTGLFPARIQAAMRARGEAVMRAKQGSSGFSFLGDDNRRDRYVKLASVVAYLQQINSKDVPSAHRHRAFFDTYTEAGRSSAFTSVRGSTGRRRFFSSANAHQIDAITGMLRAWWTERRISEEVLAVLTTVLLEAVERVSNTQGTYHDFPRAYIDSRSLKPLQLDPPAYDDVLGEVPIVMYGTAEDSLDFIWRVPRHAVLYLDPPYNFRQYTAYYFLLNILARYPYMESPSSYFANVSFVRGQNMDDDFTSSFSKASEFLPSLEALIQRARADVVVLSYFNGRNHWNPTTSLCDGRGRDEIESFFASPLFEHGVKVYPIPRRNYQSYGGHRAAEVDELVFVARRRRKGGRDDLDRGTHGSCVRGMAEIGHGAAARRAGGAA